jgi:hypothetical protein
MSDTMVFSTDNGGSFLFHRYVRVCGAEPREGFEIVVKTDDADLRLQLLHEADKQDWLKDILSMATPLAEGETHSPSSHTHARHMDALSSGSNVHGAHNINGTNNNSNTSHNGSTHSNDLHGDHKPSPFLARSLARAHMAANQPITSAPLTDDDYAAAAAAAAVASARAKQKKPAPTFSLNPFTRTLSPLISVLDPQPSLPVNPAAASPILSLNNKPPSSSTTTYTSQHVVVPANHEKKVEEFEKKPDLHPASLDDPHSMYDPQSRYDPHSLYYSQQVLSPQSYSSPPAAPLRDPSKMSWFGASASLPAPEEEEDDKHHSASSTTNTDGDDGGDGEFSEVNF